MNASFDTRGRDAYWNATQTELRSIRKRGDAATLTGALALFALVYVFRDHTQEFTTWLIAAAVMLGVIGGSLWFVTSRKRRVVIARGLVCSHCHYTPHDTEIDEVASTRTCPHCERALDS